MYEHKNKMIDGFTKRYNLTKLIYLEETSDIRSAIEREKQLKNWHRDWKMKLINNFNPEWKARVKGFEYRKNRDAEINSA